jgi:hypothetical protein
MKNASCHCGAVSVEFTETPNSVTACNCSICHRLGVLWAYYTKSQVNVVCSADAVSVYIRGDKCIEFYHCTTCGCVTHYEDIEKNGEYRIAINARMMQPEEIASLPVREFDGASM